MFHTLAAQSVGIVSASPRTDLPESSEVPVLSPENLEYRRRAAPDPDALQPTSPHDFALIVYEADGSDFRGAAYTHETLKDRASSGASRLGVREGERVWCTVPEGSPPSLWLALAAWYLGVELVVAEEELDAGTKLELLDKLQPAAVWFSDAEYAELASSPTAWVDLSSIRRVMTSGEPGEGAIAFHEVVGLTVVPAPVVVEAFSGDVAAAESDQVIPAAEAPSIRGSGSARKGRRPDVLATVEAQGPAEAAAVRAEARRHAEEEKQREAERARNEKEARQRQEQQAKERKKEEDRLRQKEATLRKLAEQTARADERRRDEEAKRLAKEERQREERQAKERRQEVERRRNDEARQRKVAARAARADERRRDEESKRLAKEERQHQEQQAKERQREDERRRNDEAKQRKVAARAAREASQAEERRTKREKHREEERLRLEQDAHRRAERRAQELQDQQERRRQEDAEKRERAARVERSRRRDGAEQPQRERLAPDVISRISEYYGITAPVTGSGEQTKVDDRNPPRNIPDPDERRSRE